MPVLTTDNISILKDDISQLVSIGEKIPQNIKEIKPTIIIGVPRFYEKTFAAINEKVDQGPALKKAIFHWAFKTGAICSKIISKGERLSASLKLKLSLAEKLVFSKLKSGLGGRLRFFVSGGAPLSSEISGFFEAAGIAILTGYGLTETSPVITCNTLKFRKTGKRRLIHSSVPGNRCSLPV